jgi:mercuric ion transport protein
MRNTASPSGRKAGGLLAFAVLASLLASTCCVLPLVLVLVGITGAWMVHLTALKPLAPFAIAITLGALGWAGWLLFRPAAACSLEDQACATNRPAMRRLFIGCAVFIALLLGFPLIAPLFY